MQYMQLDVQFARYTEGEYDVRLPVMKAILCFPSRVQPYPVVRIHTTDTAYNRAYIRLHSPWFHDKMGLHAAHETSTAVLCRSKRSCPCTPLPRPVLVACFDSIVWLPA